MTIFVKLKGMFDMNLNSVFYLLRPLIPAMRKTGNGRIVAIGSRAALEPGAGMVADSASKAGLALNRVCREG